MRMFWDQKITWTFTPEEDHRPNDLLFYVEKTEPRGPFVHESQKKRTVTEIGRVAAPSPGTEVSVTLDALGEDLEKNTAYERAVKVDDNGTERTLEQDLLFVIAPSVETNN